MEITERVKVSAEFAVSPMTSITAEKFGELAKRKGQLSFSIARAMQEAANKLVTGNLQYGAGHFQSFLSRSDIHELAEMDARYSLIEGLFQQAVFADEILAADERFSYLSAVRAEVEAIFVKEVQR